MLRASLHSDAAGVVTTLREARATQATKLAAIKVSLAQRVADFPVIPTMLATVWCSKHWSLARLVETQPPAE